MTLSFKRIRDVFPVLLYLFFGIYSINKPENVLIIIIDKKHERSADYTIREEKKEDPLIFFYYYF